MAQKASEMVAVVAAIDVNLGPFADVATIQVSSRRPLSSAAAHDLALRSQRYSADEGVQIPG